MAPLPDNSTGRYFVDYTDGLNNHTILFRSPPLTGVAGIATVANSFIQELQPIMYLGWEIIGARFAPAGSDITLPALAPNPVTPGGSTVMPGSAAPRFITWVGRGLTSGRRVRFFVFGLNLATQDDYRIDQGVNVNLDDARAALVEGFENNLCTIAGDPAVMYSYYNQGFNSYFERKQRGS